jgi:FecR protein
VKTPSSSFQYCCLAVLLACALTLGAASVSAADLAQAVVRQKVNVVTVAPSLSAAARPAATGSVVQNQNVVRTGNESRAELEFTDLTLARMGANSIFSFDSQARALEFTQGALLFSKPANSGRVEVRSGAITAAITGSTGFISNQPAAIMKTVKGKIASKETTTVLGMLEGTIKGDAAWNTPNGARHIFHFSLGSGDMLVAQANRQPMVVQFDLPRFIKSTPLINAFNRPILNQHQLFQAIANYQTDERRGFIRPTRVTLVTQPSQLGWVSGSIANSSFDASVDQLGGSSSSSSSGGSFVPVGSTGVIRGQLVWTTSADLDLHLTLPDEQHVFYANRSVTFNNGRATAALDHDNLGGVIDAPPDKRVENIAVNGTPSNGSYTFFVNSFNPSSPNASDPFTLRIGSGTHTQTLSGSLTGGQNSAPLVLVFPPHS